MTRLPELDLTTLTGSTVPLAHYRDQVLLIVNTASACGFTPQYRQLQELHQRFHAQGFSVLAFPCNQFGQQEPGDAHVIGQFCEHRYGVTFPLFAKTDVNGANADPLFVWLKHEAPGVFGSEKIKWNFTKFLVNRRGEVVARYAPYTKPDKLIKQIETLLAHAPLS